MQNIDLCYGSFYNFAQLLCKFLPLSIRYIIFEMNTEYRDQRTADSYGS